MPKIIGSLERALLRYPKLDLSNVKLIGWGAGQFFIDHYPLIKDKVNLEYTVCPWVENQGKTIHGINVKPPSALENEKPENVLILVFSNHKSEAISQISYGKLKQFPVMVALEFGLENAPLYEELQDRRSLLEAGMHIENIKNSKPKFGIFYQGLAFNFTPQVLAWNRLKYPSAYHCMATWVNQPKELLDQCRPWLDKLILIPEPDGSKGLPNLNYILRSARYGIEHLSEMDIDFSVRCRSDNIILGNSINCAIENIFGNNRNKGKIAIDLKAGWQYMPFHFSEKIMLGRTKDMLQLWTPPEDERDHTEIPSVHSEDHFQKLNNRSGEVYIWKNYAQKLGFATDSLADSYHFARQNLQAINTHMQWLSFKFIPIFNIYKDTSMIFSEERWNEMLYNPEYSENLAREISSLNMTVRDFWQKKVG